MKFFKFAVVLLAFVGLSLIGCSDKSQSPVSPADQSINQPSSLEKVFTREFSGTNTPYEVIDPGIMKYPDGKQMIMKHKAYTNFIVTYLPGDTGPDILSGNGEVEINGITDLRTLIGQWQGKFLLKPSEADGGVWQFTWHGTSTFGPTAWEGGPGWILPLQEIGHGEGGDINGMQCHMEVIIYASLDFTAWYGAFTGIVTSH